ncbi:MAG TPA: oligopeptide transporter, OPT family [Terriglobales bacterium]|nr:oligopeptide transporter, OPT family [Terriglobales bacterium]
MATITEPKTPDAKFEPYVPPDAKLKEFTPRALILGSIFGILFGGVTVYVGLRAGLTVSASIPIAVLSISILRAFGRATILENNIVQTTGNAGQSVASGVIFTLPALIFLGFQLEVARIFLLSLVGGLIGVFFMIPLRRQLIVKEHGTLTYPEGTACADVLIAGDRGGSFAGRVFWGLGLGALYTFFQNENLLSAWPSTPTWDIKQYAGASIRANTTSEYMGVGYIIGPRVAGVLLAGGVFSWLVLMPAIHFFGAGMATPIYPGTVPISQMSPTDLWRTYVRPMGAGAVACAGLITLLKTMPTIVSALRTSMKQLGGDKSERSNLRTEDDLPLSVTVGGSVLLIIMMWGFLTFKPVPGAQTSLLANIVASIFVVIFGFLFVTVSSRITGLIGSSANPVSGMTIATLMATSAIFLALGWTAPAFGALVLTIGGVVCIASSNAGDTSQDLKTGYLIGATPKWQQAALLIGVTISTFAVGYTLTGMNKGLEEFRPLLKQVDLGHLPPGVSIEETNGQRAFARDRFSYRDAQGQAVTLPGHDYYVLNSINSTEIASGKYLYNPKSGQIEVQWIQGIGSEKAPAPQAQLMSTVINGILTRKLPWGLVMLGVFLVIVVELLGIRSLAFAVGAYLSIGTTLAIFAGGAVRWLVDSAAKRAGETPAESEVSPGSLFASGLIAAGGIMGLAGIGIKLIFGADKPNPLDISSRLPAMGFGPVALNVVAVVTFLVLGWSLYHYARKPLESAERVPERK